MTTDTKALREIAAKTQERLIHYGESAVPWHEQKAARDGMEIAEEIDDLRAKLDYANTALDISADNMHRMHGDLQEARKIARDLTLFCDGHFGEMFNIVNMLVEAKTAVESWPLLDEES